MSDDTKLLMALQILNELHGAGAVALKKERDATLELARRAARRELRAYARRHAGATINDVLTELWNRKEKGSNVDRIELLRSGEPIAGLAAEDLRALLKRTDAAGITKTEHGIVLGFEAGPQEWSDKATAAGWDIDERVGADWGV